MPPLDAPHVAAGLVEYPDGTWGAPSAQPTAGQTEVIDVGPSYNPAAPAGAPGSELAPSQVSTTAGTVGAAPRDDIQTQVIKPEKGAKAAEIPPHEKAGLVEHSDGTWGLPTQTAEEPPNPIPPSVQNQEMRSQPWYQHLADTVHGITGAVTHGATFGLDEIVSPIPAAIATSLMEGISFTKAYDKEVAKMRQPRTEFERENPKTGTAIEVGAGLPGTAAMGPLFATAPEGAGLLRTAGTYARNVGAGSATGGATGFTMTDGDVDERLQGAKLGAEAGGALTAATPLVTQAARTLASPVQAVVAAARPQATARQTVGRTLTEPLPGGTGAPGFTPSPIPGMPLNVAQSGPPELGPIVDILGNTREGIPARLAERSAQNQSMLGHLPGNQAGGTAPEVNASRASAAASENIRTAGEIIGAEERRLWNTPLLSQPNITTQTMKDELNAAVTAMQHNTPGLADAYDHSGLPMVVRDANAMPVQAAANEMNSISSRFREIARDPSQPSDVRAIARRLANNVQDGIWHSPEIAGRAATSTLPQFPQPGWARAAAQGTRVTTPAIPSNPQLVSELQAARAFTRREAQVLGHASFDSIFKRNGAGNLTATDETGLNKFFDFRNGAMRPGDVRNVTQFLDDIRQQMLTLGNQGVVGRFDAAAVQQVRDELAQNTRDYLIAKMLSMTSAKELDRAGDQMMSPAGVSTWIRRNAGLLQRTGVFEPAQMAAIQRVGEAARLIQRGENSGRPLGSATFSRLTGNHFIDALLPPGVAPRAAMVLGTITGALVSGVSGGVVGLVAAGAFERTGMGQRMLETMFRRSHAEAMELLNRAIRDPQLAHDLMMEATARNARRMSNQARDFLRAAFANLPVDQGMRTVGPGQQAVPASQ